MIITVTLNASIDKTAIINNFNIGKINRLDKPLEMAGGKGLNVTRTLITLGQKVTATGFIGGKSGEKLKILMDNENIKNDFQEINDDTRSCLAIIDKESKTITELNENGPNITDKELLLFKDKLANLTNNADLCVISGSVPKSLSSDIYYELITLLKENNDKLIVALDASKQALKKSIHAKPDIIKPNKSEAEDLLGFHLDSKENLIKGIKYLNDYCKLSCITLEDKGCIIGNKDEIYMLNPPVINLVNSVGSGDAFLAGLIYSYIQNMSIIETGKWAISSGTANAMTDRAGLCYMNDIKNILSQIQVKKIL